MTNEERQIIADFVARVGGAPAASGAWSGGSVPATTTPALPPIDREADAFIAEQFNQHPEARYRLTQLAFVQEHALVEAQNRMKQLEGALQAAQQASQQNQGGGGFFSGLFGGGRSQQPPPGQGGPQGGQWGGQWGQRAPGAGPPPGYQQQYAPPPQYPPNYNPGMFQRQGSGFLGSALTTAAGVAGGVLAADAIRDMFSPHQGMGIGGGFTPGMASPWAAPVTPDPGYVDQGTWDQPDPTQGGDAGSWSDPGSNLGNADPGSDPGTVDPGSDPGAGWDDQSGGSDDSLI